MVGNQLAIGLADNAVHRNDVFDVVLGVAKDGPQLHANLSRDGKEVFAKVLHPSVIQLVLEDTSSGHLLDKSSVLVDAEVLGLVDLAIVKDLLDGDLMLVLAHEVAESNSSLETEEAASKVVQKVTVTTFLENIKGSSGSVEAIHERREGYTLLGSKSDKCSR